VRKKGRLPSKKEQLEFEEGKGEPEIEDKQQQKGGKR